MILQTHSNKILDSMESINVNFVGGRLEMLLVNWNIITQDPKILQTIKGHKITFKKVR